METRYRFIANNVLFLFVAFVGTTNCTSLNSTDPNVCPKRVNVGQSVNQTQWIIECCPNFVNQNGKCQACPSGTYGEQCSKECICANDADCDPVSGDCLCSVGWFGDHCTKVCPTGKFGKNCNGTCACSNVEQCDVQTGKCIKCNPEPNKEECNSHIDEVNNLNSGQNSYKSNDNVIVYITMVAALIGIVCVVTMVVKVKERLCRQLQQSLKDTSKPKLKRRMATRSLPLTQTQNAQTGSYIINTEGVMFQPEIEEDLYCEIGDIHEFESDRY
ncbi:unnamed protein product [Mytilus edulis]|uniref:EGF-like domain-containing protein n=1 Tax=Mytilus edulis TaxID=6550 RepID=A0A8S3UGK4_MYTED|nr:unnamed protein product [Mytilus edulis]